MSQIQHSTIFVINGAEQNTSPHTFVKRLGNRTGVKENLALFLDFPAASPTQLSDVAQLFAEAYANASGGITAALRHACKLANDRLLALNRGAPQPIQGSLTCALVTGEHLIIAQAGPAIAYARSADGAFEPMTNPPDTPLLGATRSAELNFRNIAPRPGDVFLLTGAGSITNTPQQLIEACMGKGDPRMVAGYLNANVRDGALAGVVFTLVDDDPTDETVIAQPKDTQIAAKPSPAPAPIPQPVEPHQPAGAGLAQKIVDGIRAGKAAVGIRAAQAAKNAGKGIGEFSGQLLPQTPPPVSDEQRSRASLFGLGAVAVLLPIAVAAIVAISYLQLSGEAEKQQQRALVRAQLEQAKATNDPAAWTKTIELTNAYEQKFKADEQISAARLQARDQLDKLYGVARIRPARLAELLPANRRLAAAPLGLYTLDGLTGETLYHTLSPDHASITGKPVPIAPAAAGGEAPFKDITWASSTSNRWHSEGAVLASTAALGEYSLATGQLAPTRFTSDPPGNVASIDLFGDQIYILDTGIGQIWRVRPEAGNITRSSYFRSPYNPLKEGVDMAIDGAVYILQRNGSLLKYVASQPVQFALQNLPEPMSAPVAIALLGPNRDVGNVFVADAKNGSVFQFDKNGLFIRQYRGVGDEFAGIIDLASDPTTNTLYVLTQKNIYSFKPQ